MDMLRTIQQRSPLKLRVKMVGKIPSWSVLDFTILLGNSEQQIFMEPGFTIWKFVRLDLSILVEELPSYEAVCQSILSKRFP